MKEKLIKVFNQLRQMEKKSVIIGLIIFISVFYLLVSPALAAKAYGDSLIEVSQSEGYETVEDWKAALQEVKSREAGSSYNYILELDGYITLEDKGDIGSYEKGLTAAKSFAEFNEIYASRENWLSEKRLNKENSEKLALALEKGADFSVVDWSVGRDAFIAEGTYRIDIFLAGSPLAGYGYQFAQSAGDYCVDPRGSPAISFIESGKGKDCFRRYNAGGGGHVSGSCWEVAIDEHILGLSENYGYTLSEGAARKYCPPTGRDWNYSVRITMERI